MSLPNSLFSTSFVRRAMPGLRFCLGGGLALGLLGVIAGCTAVTEETRATIAYALQKPDSVELSADEVAAFPYTALYARWTDGPQALLVLGYVDSNEFSWVSADRETLITKQGRVIRTAGVDYDLVGVSNLAADPLRCIVTAPDACERTWQREIEVQVEIAHQRHLDHAYSRALESRFEVLGTEQLELAAGVYDVTRVEEHGVVRFSGREQGFTNVFWLEADGHVIKSVQQVVPQRASLELTQMKWVGR